MKRSLIEVGTAIGLMTLAWTAAAVPSLINFQGTLTDSTGTPLASGLYTIEFRVWNKPIAGEPDEQLVWGRTYEVPVANGRFNVILGGDSGTVIEGAAINDITFAFGDDERYMGITPTHVDGVPMASSAELAPRQQVLSTPYAIKATNADEALHALEADHSTQADSATQADIARNGAPIGTILAWHKSFEYTPELPEGWVECNGQTLDLLGSPYNGLTIPNLNGAGVSIAGGETKGPFLRGHSESGQTEFDQSNHLDAVHTNANDGAPLGTWETLPENGAQIRTSTWYESSRDSMFFRLKGRETRPVAFTVVWIMRVF